MQKDINIESVKQYNASLKQYKDASAKLTAEIEFNERELKTLCEQLTRELGVEVTVENIDKIYEEQVQKINQALETGTAILSKIEQEASGATQSTQNIGYNQSTFGGAMGVAQTPPQAPIFGSKPATNTGSLTNPGALNGGTPFFSL